MGTFLEGPNRSLNSADHHGCSANASVENLWIMCLPPSPDPHIQYWGRCFQVPKTRSVIRPKNTIFPGLLALSELLPHPADSPETGLP